MCKHTVYSAYRYDIELTRRTYSIVGKGNHSVNHIQKIKPRVEQICQQMGLQYSTEQNEGRMYINLQGGPANMPPYPQPPQGGQQHHGGQHQSGQPGYAGGQQQYSGGQQEQQQQGNQNQDEVEKLVIKLLPRIIRKLEGCCVVM